MSGKDLIKQLYNREELNGRPDGFFFRIRTFNKKLGIVFTDGAIWEEQRQFSVKTLKSLGLGRLNMIENIEREAKELIKSLQRKSTAGEVITVQSTGNNIFDISVMNVMWMMLRGERYELDDPLLIDLMEAIHKSFTIVDMSGGVLSHWPLVRHICPDKSGYRPLVETLQPLWTFLKVRGVPINTRYLNLFNLSQRNISQVLEHSSHEHDPQNFIELYCRQITQQSSGDSFFNSEQLLALCVDFFQAGSETTSNTLTFAMLYMLHYPDVKSKVKQELRRVVGAARLPKLIDRGNLKYTEATIFEIQRMANVAPLGKQEEN